MKKLDLCTRCKRIKSTTRVIRVRRSRPFELLEDFPINVLDALAEA